MRQQQRFFKDNPGRYIKSFQAFLLLVPLVWGLRDAAKEDGENALLKLMWFLLMLASYANGYMFGDSNKKQCNTPHFKPQCDLPHFPADAKFIDEEVPVEVRLSPAMSQFLSEKTQEMEQEHKRDIYIPKEKDTEPGLYEEEGREYSQKLRV